MFLRVVAEVARRHPQVQGWLIGDGPEREALERLAVELGVSDQVRFFGRRADVPRLVAQADLLCHCSYSEGLSNAIMEASALGLPVVVTRAGGTEEIVEEGVTGHLVDPDDHAAMARRVAALLDDSGMRARMGEAGRRKMETEFSLERMVGDMVAVYQEMLARRDLALQWQ
jgi:glycosyltransferase involved in cell wall biosynthesis